jgi:hypothetical protein
MCASCRSARTREPFFRMWEQDLRGRLDSR